MAAEMGRPTKRAAMLGCVCECDAKTETLTEYYLLN